MIINFILICWFIGCLVGLYLVGLSLQGLSLVGKQLTKNGLYYWDDQIQAWRKIKH